LIGLLRLPWKYLGASSRGEIGRKPHNATQEDNAQLAAAEWDKKRRNCWARVENGYVSSRRSRSSREIGEGCSGINKLV